MLVKAWEIDTVRKSTNKNIDLPTNFDRLGIAACFFDCCTIIANFLRLRVGTGSFVRTENEKVSHASLVQSYSRSSLDMVA